MINKKKIKKKYISSGQHLPLTCLPPILPLAPAPLASPQSRSMLQIERQLYVPRAGIGMKSMETMARRTRERPPPTTSWGLNMIQPSSGCRGWNTSPRSPQKHRSRIWLNLYIILPGDELGVRGRYPPKNVLPTHLF